jgi:hypothetical protein
LADAGKPPYSAWFRKNQQEGTKKEQADLRVFVVK